MKVHQVSLQIKLILALVLFSALMTALVSGIELYQRFEEGVKDLHRAFEQVRSSHLSTLAQNLWRFDEPSLKLEMESILNGGSVTLVEVTDDLGGVRRAGTLPSAGRTITVSYPLIHPSQPASIGTLVLYGTDAPLRKAVEAQVPLILLTELAKAASAAVFLFFVFYRLFGRHLNRIIAFTDSLTIQNLAQTIDLQRRPRRRYPDELDRLAGAVNHLSQRLRDDVEERRQTALQIAAKNKELEQIVYVASHDLRSPLVNVDGYSRELEYLVRQIGEILDGDSDPGPALAKLLADGRTDLVQALQYIRGSTRQMDKLLKGLLELSRSGRAALTVVDLDVNGLLARTAANFEFQASQCGAQISVEPVPGCRGDEVQVGQVFANLIGNALKYRDPGRPLTVRIGGRTDGGRSVYFVEDNGIGIAPEHQEKIFELFHRLNPGASEGEGLGLTLVRQILSRLDGTVRVESEAGAGSRFVVTLPGPAGAESEPGQGEARP